MSFTTFIFIGFAVSIVIFILKLIVVSGNKKMMEEAMAKQEDFTPTQQLMSEDGTTGLAVDEGRKKIALIRGQFIRTIDYKDLISSEIFEDGSAVTRTVRSSQLGGALVGGIALGGVGAIIGGLSGKKVTDDKVKQITLRITVDSTSSPIHEVGFMNYEAKKSEGYYRSAMARAQHWHGLMEVLIRRADEATVPSTPQLSAQWGNPTQAASVADEIKKLVDLRVAGILTEEEFAQQKARLLS